MSLAVAWNDRPDVSDPPFKPFKPVILNLPYPPSANDMWEMRAGKGGQKKLVLAGRYKRWLNDAGWLAKAQRSGFVRGPYRLCIHAVRPDNKRRDLDNIIKPLSDLLVSIGAVTDDSFCQEITARWIKNGEGVCIIIEPTEAI